MACVFCENAVFALDHLPLLLSYRKANRDKAHGMRDGDWEAVYGNIDRMINKVINHFSRRDIEIASGEMTSLGNAAGSADPLSTIKTLLTY